MDKLNVAYLYIKEENCHISFTHVTFLEYFSRGFGFALDMPW